MHQTRTPETTKLNNLLGKYETLGYHQMTRMDHIIQNIWIDFDRRKRVKITLWATLSWRGGVMEMDKTDNTTP